MSEAEVAVDPFSIQVKAEFITDKRPECLPPLPKASEQQHPAQGERKKRPRDPREADSDRYCMTFLRGEKCPFENNCKFSHDLKQLLDNRPPDLTTIEGGCPCYSLFGFCQFGAACRLALSHINTATGENLRKEGCTAPVLPMNSLDKEVQTLLRRKKYPFKHWPLRKKDHLGKDGNEGGPSELGKDTASKSKGNDDGDFRRPVEVDQPEQNKVDTGMVVKKSVDLSPLPTRTRKLIDFSNKVYVAPLTTVGNLPFRRIMKRFGADITCGEMAIASNLLQGQASEWALLKRHPEEDLFGVQIAAGHAELFTKTCELIENHVSVDFVDLNLGCPLDLVNNKGSGAALMLRHGKLKSALEGITSVLSCPVTVKMRTGWDEKKPFAHQLVSRIQSWGLDGIGAIMIHGRSRLQRYSKEADWDYIQQVAQSQSPDLPRIPLIGNGDIFSYSDYETKIAREGVSTCAMLARGALIKPWLPTEIKERRHWDISASERFEMLKQFTKYGLEHWGSDQKGVNNCRRFLLEWLSFLHRYVRKSFVCFDNNKFCSYTNLLQF